MVTHKNIYNLFRVGFMRKDDALLKSCSSWIDYLGVFAPVTNAVVMPWTMPVPERAFWGKTLITGRI